MHTPSPGPTLRSGELARLTGVSRDTLRLYERRGLLPAPTRSESGYRRYDAAAAHRVRLIRAALSIGFTIDELGEILQARDRGAAPCRQVHALAIQKASSLEARIVEIAEPPPLAESRDPRLGSRAAQGRASGTRRSARKIPGASPGEHGELLAADITRAQGPIAAKARTSAMRNESSIRAIALGSVVMLAPAAARASGGGMEDCPMHAQHQQTERESKAMGFSQERTTHHFVLAADGGRIQVTANAADDRTTIEQVRSHLKQIAEEFKTGDFATPLLVHGQTPPGVPAMRNLKSEISVRVPRPFWRSCGGDPEPESRGGRGRAGVPALSDSRAQDGRPSSLNRSTRSGSRRRTGEPFSR